MRRSSGAAAGVAAALVALGVAAPAVGGISGYGPVGPDPATELGLSVPVLAAEVSGPEGSTLRTGMAGLRVEVDRPAGYSDGSQVMSVTDLSGPGVAAALLPPETVENAHVVLAVGVGVRSVDTVPGPAPARASSSTPTPTEVGGLTMVMHSPSLVGATVVVVSDVEVTTVSSGSSVTLDLAGPAAVFALQPGPGPEVELTGADASPVLLDVAAAPVGEPGVAAAAPLLPTDEPALGSALWWAVGLIAGALLLGANRVRRLRRSRH